MGRKGRAHSHGNWTSLSRIAMRLWESLFHTSLSVVSCLDLRFLLSGKMHRFCKERQFGLITFIFKRSKWQRGEFETLMMQDAPVSFSLFFISLSLLNVCVRACFELAVSISASTFVRFVLGQQCKVHAHATIDIVWEKRCLYGTSRMSRTEGGEENGFPS